MSSTYPRQIKHADKTVNCRGIMAVPWVDEEY